MERHAAREGVERRQDLARRLRFRASVSASRRHRRRGDAGPAGRARFIPRDHHVRLPPFRDLRQEPRLEVARAPRLRRARLGVGGVLPQRRQRRVAHLVDARRVGQAPQHELHAQVAAGRLSHAQRGAHDARAARGVPRRVRRGNRAGGRLGERGGAQTFGVGRRRRRRRRRERRRRVLQRALFAPNARFVLRRQSTSKGGENCRLPSVARGVFLVRGAQAVPHLPQHLRVQLGILPRAPRLQELRLRRERRGVRVGARRGGTRDRRAPEPGAHELRRRATPRVAPAGGRNAPVPHRRTQEVHRVPSRLFLSRRRLVARRVSRLFVVIATRELVGFDEERLAEPAERVARALGVASQRRRQELARAQKRRRRLRVDAEGARQGVGDDFFRQRRARVRAQRLERTRDVPALEPQLDRLAHVPDGLREVREVVRKAELRQQLLRGFLVQPRAVRGEEQAQVLRRRLRRGRAPLRAARAAHVQVREPRGQLRHRLGLPCAVRRVQARAQVQRQRVVLPAV